MGGADGGAPSPEGEWGERKGPDKSGMRGAILEEKGVAARTPPCRLAATSPLPEGGVS